MNKPTKQKNHQPYIPYKESSPFQILPVILFSVFLLIIMRLVVFERPMQQFYWSSDNTLLTDVFSYSRTIVILIIAAVSLIAVLFEILMQTLRIKKTFVYIPMAIYSVLVILSYLFSEYKEFALLGWNDRFEGTLTLLAYMVMFFYTINYVNSEKNIKYVLYPLGVISAFTCTIGILQFYGYSIFKLEAFQKLIIPSEYWNQLDKIVFNVGNATTQFLFNQNYVAFYITLLISLFSMLAIREDNMPKKIMWSALVGILLFNLVGSLSSGGFLGLGVSVIVAVATFGFKRLASWWKSLAILLVFAVLVVVATFPQLSSELKTLSSIPLPKFQEIVIAEELDTPAEAPVAPAKSVIDYIETTPKAILISINGTKLSINVENNNISSVTDVEGKPVELDNNVCSISQGKSQDGSNIAAINIDDMNWYFGLTDQGIFYINEYSKLVEIKPVPTLGFKGNETFGTNRGYIWSRTLPMLKDTILIGYGADTFILYFPHYDYAGRYNVDFITKGHSTFVDKPHNMYLGAAVGTGVISVIALLTIYMFYAVQSFKLYRKLNYTSFIEYAGVGIFIGVCGFLAAGLVNDSNVGVMPLFYGLLGIGISINMMLKRNAQ